MSFALLRNTNSRGVLAWRDGRALLARGELRCSAAAAASALAGAALDELSTVGRSDEPLDPRAHVTRWRALIVLNTFHLLYVIQLKLGGKSRFGWRSLSYHSKIECISLVRTQLYTGCRIFPTWKMSSPSCSTHHFRGRCLAPKKSMATQLFASLNHGTVTG